MDIDISKLFDIGFSAVLLYLYIRQEARITRMGDYIQSILTELLAANERDRVAERQRRKIGRAVDADLDGDTEGSRPLGLDSEIQKRGLNKP